MNTKKRVNLLNNNPEKTEETLVSRLDNRIYKSSMTLYTCTKCRLSFVDRNSNYIK